METIAYSKPDIANILYTVKSMVHSSGRYMEQDRKVFNRLLSCRTSKLGGHVDQCNECGKKVISYNSCRDRHCPKCQYRKKEKWILDRSKDLLPINYLHLVFTLPHELNTIVYENKENLLNLLNVSARDSIQLLEKNPKYLGARTGFMFILHTWGQTLTYHPHIHCIITGGGLDEEENWKEIKNNYLFPVKVLSRLFKGKFMGGLRKLLTDNLLSYTVSDSDLKEMINNSYKKEWVVYAKEPFENPEYLLEYLGRYTHRIAISNSRILKHNDEEVTFSYKDYSDGDKRKEMTLSNYEFTRRFLLHVLPFRFCKIRYYGILCNRKRRENVEKIRKILDLQNRKLRKELMSSKPQDFCNGTGLYKCTFCNKGVMVVLRFFQKHEHPS